MNRKANAVLETMLLLVAVIVTSGVVLLLVQTGVLEVRADTVQPNVLNTEFIPLGREGFLALKEFKFCQYVNNDFVCVNEGNFFVRGSDIYVLFLMESSPYNGEVMLVRNYQIKNSNGEIVLNLDEKNNYDFEQFSKKEKESVAFADYFGTDASDEVGEYTLDVMIENPLLNKRLVVSKKFVLG
jgi:hypothetical protein